MSITFRHVRGPAVVGSLMQISPYAKYNPTVRGDGTFNLPDDTPKVYIDYLIREGHAVIEPGAPFPPARKAIPPIEPTDDMFAAELNEMDTAQDVAPEQPETTATAPAPIVPVPATEEPTAATPPPEPDSSVTFDAIELWPQCLRNIPRCGQTTIAYIEARMPTPKDVLEYDDSKRPPGRIAPSVWKAIKELAAHIE